MYIIKQHRIDHYKERSIFVSRSKNLAWTKQQVQVVLYNRHEPSYGVCSSCEARDIGIFPLSPSILVTRIASGESIWGSRSKKDRLLKNQ
jgi:hypothetical protein